MAVARIIGTGIYAPGDPIDNAELKRLTGIEFDAAKHEAKLGIARRHIARLSGLDETTADFAEKAARAALADASLDPMEVGMFVVATDTPEYISPATGILLQGRLQRGETESRAFDVGASCASFVTALDMAARAVASDPSLRYALVVGVYNMPAYIRDGDTFGWSIFADGAGAVLLGRDDTAPSTHDDASSQASGYVEGVFRADGTQWNYVGVYAGGTRKPVTKELLDAGAYGLELLQRLPGDRNVKLWPPLVRRLLEKAGVAQSEVAHYIFTQINRSVIAEVMGILGEPMEKTTTIMDRFGYTGSACVPMALHEALLAGSVRKGDLVVLVASGAGLAVGASLIRL
ncbi:MAG TPA: ketoacyl-ACP synthase III [Rectinemataceae bacterium]|nr:ketoacyl-ACP synthase III [Rectinemataceae bacterium]